MNNLKETHPHFCISIPVKSLAVDNTWGIHYEEITKKMVRTCQVKKKIRTDIWIEWIPYNKFVRYYMFLPNSTSQSWEVIRPFSLEKKRVNISSPNIGSVQEETETELYVSFHILPLLNFVCFFNIMASVEALNCMVGGWVWLIGRKSVF